MGHDITAYNPTIDRDAAEREFNEIPHNAPDWCDEYYAYRATIAVAELRRSAGDPLNQVIYLALGVHDEAYAGCSGNGISLQITAGQFRSAFKLLRKKRFDGMARPQNMADDILKLCADAGMAVVQSDNRDTSADRELTFCEDCFSFCNRHGVDSLEVQFG